jgi:hypothetical protein
VATAKKAWTIATARQHLPELIGRAASEPQRVYRRDKLVAAVVSPAVADKLEGLQHPSLADKFAELQQICAEENYELPIAPRHNRANPFASRQRSSSRPRRAR